MKREGMDKGVDTVHSGSKYRRNLKWFSVSQTISSPSNDEEEVDVPAESNITAAQAKNAVHILQRFMECSENMEKEDFAAIFRFENLVEKQFEKWCCQVTMTMLHFF
ncbi:hypothetical protein AVEN_35615-1 [Araneus ventricosus]|uniref:Uncharacterized protein n=1 Tax=Araneus ventricosus TaxID=182803 RepID=A0A4Y2CJ57_ARAVE|nr:hypothetical protein AVEN_35615-1 [Araneus ventricosus]